MLNISILRVFRHYGIRGGGGAMGIVSDMFWGHFYT